MNLWLPVLLLSGGLVGVLGATLLAHSPVWQDLLRKQLMLITIGFFAGFILTVILGYDFRASPYSVFFLISGLLTAWVWQKRLLKRDPCCQIHVSESGLGLVGVAGLAICALNDGVLIGLLKPGLLSSFSIGMIFHKTVSAFLVSQIIGYPKKAFGYFIALLYVLISPVAFFGGSWLHHWAESVGSGILAFSAGYLGWMVFHALFPAGEWSLTKKPSNWAGLILAFLVAIGLGSFHQTGHKILETEKAHHHNHHHDH